MTNSERPIEEVTVDLEYCRIDRRGRISIVTIRRPGVRNALHRPANLELERVFDAFETDPSQWVAIVTGEGDQAFCAGNDLKFAAAGNDTTLPPSGFGGLTARFSRSKPIIAAVNGVAMGGGFEIALACDLIVAAEPAMFALPEPRVGLAALGGGLIRLPRCISTKHAMGLILTGRSVSATEAFQMGILNEVVPAGEALIAAVRWAQQILECSPTALRAAREVVSRTLEAAAVEAAYREQRIGPAVQALLQSADRIEGPRAFSEKRKPNWRLPDSSVSGD